MATYARVRRLTKQGDRDIGPTFRRLAELLRNSRSTGTLRCTILVGEKSRSWTFELKGRDCRLLRGAATLPDLEIITLEATWVEIADGDCRRWTRSRRAGCASSRHGVGITCCGTWPRVVSDINLRGMKVWPAPSVASISEASTTIGLS
jgi:hypothetical protein